MNILTSIHDWLGQLTATAVAQTSQPLSYPRPEIQPNFLQLVQDNLSQFLFWSATAGVIIIAVLLVSIARRLETWLDPLLHRIKKFAPFVMQITLGSTLLLSAYHEAIFGSGMPLAVAFGDWMIIAQWFMYVAGIMLVLGIFPRLAAFGVLVFFIPILLAQEWQALNHTAFFGEGVTILLLGGSYELIHSPIESALRLKRTLRLHLHKYKFILLRIAFGLSVIYAGFHSYLLSSDTLLGIITDKNLAAGLGVEPSFLLLALLLTEIGLGIFFIIGFEIRFAAVVYAFLLIVSMTIFGETVWSQITLLGTAAAMFTHGYDRYTLGGYLFGRGNLEPIL